MQLLRGLHNPGLGNDGVGQKCVATIGNFDGVHLGHQAIIQQVISEAKSRNLAALVVIFEPQPMEFFKGKDAPVRLMRFREKFQALSGLGLNYVFCLKFDAKLSQLSAESFVQKVLVSHLNIAHLVIGDDFRFGGDRLGDFSLLVKEGKKQGFTVENTPTVLDYSLDKTAGCSTRVSSSHVRSLLSDAKFKAAETLLGRPYAIMGRVIHGEKLGRQLGFPTANIALLRVNSPLSGVYVVSLERQDKTKIKGVANIGVKPTVGNFKPSLEVHLFHFDEEIYGENVTVCFHHKLRDEKRFQNVVELQVQIEKDVRDAKRYIDKDSIDKDGIDKES